MKPGTSRVMGTFTHCFPDRPTLQVLLELFTAMKDEHGIPADAEVNSVSFSGPEIGGGWQASVTWTSEIG